MSEPIPTEDLTFEQAFAELEELVAQLERGDLPLEEALVRFERGQALADHCNELLERAELKLRKLEPDDSAGFVETDFQE
jgi:exodeoxyribonuclease VII small subunit